MDHVAIMNPKLGLIEKILTKEKRIESRWYLTRKAPFNRIIKDESIYFKNAGGMVCAKAKVSKVLQFEFMKAKMVSELVNKYGSEGKIALQIKKAAYDLYKNKKLCILMFLENPKKITPFAIDKRGFGIGSAWLVVNNINDIKKKHKPD